MASTALDSLETTLEGLVENFRQLGIIVSDFQPQGQTALNNKLNQIIGLLKDIERVKNQVNDIQVPLDVFDYIDEGRNPHSYTKDCMERSLAKNELVKGKIDEYRRFKALLLLELSQEFPNEMSKYRAVRGDERMS
ncbi:mediator of RNA polymerase II transcription subunit 10-like protein [Euroglyphus maynei]|uniref:Mediator of RNA polymerase II transcription subunit 10 n=1 Tax=Euroglyphus maynei TaxID=6958 RepID=A0A1Y3B1J7_EURMA|nr:mediator of RNA polymerase II transcription subunit 10-like protein [Euroglyphus maynei]